MVLTVEQLRGVPITSPSLGSLKLRHVVVDYHKLTAVALVLSRGSLLGRAITIPLAETSVTQDTLTIAGSGENGKEIKARYADEQRFGNLDERSVFTERKRYLGKLATYKIDTDTGAILALWVRPPLALRGLWRQILLISRSQIVRITPDSIIVDEAIIKSALKPATAAEIAGATDAETAFGAASAAE